MKDVSNHQSSYPGAQKGLKAKVYWGRKFKFKLSLRFDRRTIWNQFSKPKDPTKCVVYSWIVMDRRFTAFTNQYKKVWMNKRLIKGKQEHSTRWYMHFIFHYNLNWCTVSEWKQKLFSPGRVTSPSSPVSDFHCMLRVSKN